MWKITLRLTLRVQYSFPPSELPANRRLSVVEAKETKIQRFKVVKVVWVVVLFFLRQQGQQRTTIVGDYPSANAQGAD